MPIANYTTEVSAEKSIGEIHGMLVAHGASHILTDYDDGKPAGIAFIIATPYQEGAMSSTNSHLCAHCLQPLIRVFCYLACDNYHCYLFRERQGYVPREDTEPQGKPKETSERVLRSDYQKYLTRQNEAYHFARNLGIPSALARDLRHRGKKEIEKVAKELVRV